MKTLIMLREGWVEIASFDFILPLSKGDIVEYEGTEYKIDAIVLNIEYNQIEILL
jgi:hypothetical protein